MEAAVQPYVDGGISKTVTLPSHFPSSDLPGILTKAYDLQLKGCTVYREEGRPGVMVRGYLTEPGALAEGVARCCDMERESD